MSGSTCTVTNPCAQPYPTCYNEVQYFSNEGAAPANVLSVFDTVNGTYTYPALDLYITITPDVIDENIGGSTASEVVSNAISPSPLMVGQQVKLEASPAGVLTGGVKWSFDSAALSDVVGSYSTSTPNAMLTPHPVSTSGNPLTFYWVSGSTAKTIYFITHATGVQGPLVDYVYYPVKTATIKTASATTAPSGAQVSEYGNGQGEGPSVFTETCGATPPPGITYVEALHLGNYCIPHGIDWEYTVTVPQIGAGQISIVQLINFAETFTKGTNSASYNFYGKYELDGSFPYDGGYAPNPQATVGAGGTASLVGLVDAPASLLIGITCTKVTRLDQFDDYFMYESNGGTHKRPAIPVTLATMAWSWGGTATTTNGGKTWNGSSFTSPPPSLSSTASTTLPWYQANNDTLLNAIPSPDPCSAL